MNEYKLGNLTAYFMLALLTGSILAFVYGQLLLAIFLLAIPIFLGAITGKHNQKIRVMKWEELASLLGLDFKIVTSKIPQWNDYILVGMYKEYEITIKTELVLKLRGPHQSFTAISVELHNPVIGPFSLIPISRWDELDNDSITVHDIYDITHTNPETFIKDLSDTTKRHLVRLYHTQKTFQIWLFDGMLNFKKAREISDAEEIENIFAVLVSLGKDLENNQP